MRNLTKTQWTMLIISVVSMIFTTLLSGVFQIGATGLAIVGILKFAWDAYLSFSAQDVSNFANNDTKMARKSGMVTKADVKAWVELEKLK